MTELVHKYQLMLGCNWLQPYVVFPETPGMADMLQKLASSLCLSYIVIVGGFVSKSIIVFREKWMLYSPLSSNGKLCPLFRVDWRP